MSVAEHDPSVAERRAAAVAATVDKVRRIEADMGVNYDALERIKQELIELSRHTELFPAQDFPLGPDDSNMIYRLSEDPDHRFALYMSTGKTGKETPPHDHTTWAVIVGLKGKEHNRFYERVDDRSVPGRGEVRVKDQFTVELGTGVTLMPEDIHSIHLEGAPPTLMFHMYGLALDHLHKRVAYDVEAGTYAHFPASDNIR